MAWDASQPSPAQQFISSLGAKALASGIITPQTAAQNASSLGLNSSSNFDMSSSGDDPSQAVNPVAVATGSVPPPSPPSHLPQGFHSLNSTTDKNISSGGTKANTYLDNAKIQGLSKELMGLPQFQQQQQDENDLRSAVNQNADYQKNLSHMDWSPLISYADSISGTNNAKNYQPPMSAQDLMNNQLSAKKALLSADQSSSKDLLDSFVKLKSGTATDNYYNSMAKLAQQGVGSPTGQGALGNARMINAVAGAGAKFDSDPILKQLVQTKNSLQRAGDIASGSVPVDAQSLYTLQNDISNAVAPGGYATDGKLKAEVLNPLVAEISNIKAKYGNSVTDLRAQDPALFKQLSSKISQISDVYNQQGQNRVQGIAANYGHVNNDDVAATVKDKTNYYNNQVFSNPAPAPTQGAKPLAQMTNQELKDYIASHGSGG